MPHICIEYSANLETHVDFPARLQALADSAIATGVFPVGGVRIRAYAATHYRIADGPPENSFVHVLLKDRPWARCASAQSRRGHGAGEFRKQSSLPTPFGGVKASRIGRDGGDYSFDFYMDTKNICLAHGTHRVPKMGA